jgi:hypothetical protein
MEVNVKVDCEDKLIASLLVNEIEMLLRKYGHPTFTDDTVRSFSVNDRNSYAPSLNNIQAIRFSTNHPKEY